MQAAAAPWSTDPTKLVLIVSTQRGASTVLAEAIGRHPCGASRMSYTSQFLAWLQYALHAAVAAPPPPADRKQANAVQPLGAQEIKPDIET